MKRGEEGYLLESGESGLSGTQVLFDEGEVLIAEVSKPNLSLFFSFVSPSCYSIVLLTIFFMVFDFFYFFILKLTQNGLFLENAQSGNVNNKSSFIIS